MFTDMVGSTALAQTNETEALRLRDEQEDLLRPLFAAHQGRAIKSIGDGFLVDFDSALHAIQCAIHIQERIHERNGRLGAVPLYLRIGIHLGDVEVRGTDIFGDSVNVASRIEPLAEPGGICVTEPVFGQVRNKVPHRLEKLAPQSLKGIRYPVDIYRVVLPWKVGRESSPDIETTGLAVLPFTNISPDPNDAYFADGLTEELITVLSQFGGLRVIARTSVMPYRASAKGVAQIGAELRVSSILEGSVRKAGNRLRVTAQLIDVRSEGHVWAKAYDRELDDIFAVQSELARAVAEVLKVELRPSEETRLKTRPVVRPDSYLAYLRGQSHVNEAAWRADEDTLRDAQKEFERAISLDPSNASAYSGLATVIHLLGSGWEGAPRSDWVDGARRAVARAIELDPGLAQAHVSLGLIRTGDYEYTSAEEEFKVGLAANPSDSFAHLWYANLLMDRGRPEEALLQFRLAEGADPYSRDALFGLVQLLNWL